MTTHQLRQSGLHAARRPPLSKVPEVTACFWIIKVLTTGMGETTSDFLVHTLNPAIAVGLGGLGLIAALAVQFTARRYLAWIYWTTVVMVSVAGTMAADTLHVGLGVPYLVSTPFFAAALAVILLFWHRTERTLSIHSIHTRRREAFYWATVLATFALGTAAGDLTAMPLGLGYLGSGVMFAVVFAIPGLAYWRLGMNPVLSFWFAYVVTRPLGASFADWMAVSRARGGLALGLWQTSLAWTLLICAFVAYLAVSAADNERTEGPVEFTHH
jgi:uncharacterized membrane-anchored protein